LLGCFIMGLIMHFSELKKGYVRISSERPSFLWIVHDLTLIGSLSLRQTTEATLHWLNKRILWKFHHYQWMASPSES
jgi:hypothetical protein